MSEEFVKLATFDNYISAHIAMGRLQEKGINCWLKDEHALDPLIAIAVGGVKLMVDKLELERATEILQAPHE